MLDDCGSPKFSTYQHGWGDIITIDNGAIAEDITLTWGLDDGSGPIASVADTASVEIAEAHRYADTGHKIGNVAVLIGN